MGVYVRMYVWTCELLLSTLFIDVELLTEPRDGQFWLI